MRLSRPAPAALRPGTVLPAVVLAAGVCLAAAACHSPAPAAGSAYGPTSTAPTATMPASTPATSGQDMLTVRKTSAGYVLATRTGQTIYWYSDDVKGSGKSTCTGTCLTAWPAVTGSPVAAAGVQLAGKLGTITRAGGVVQATYNGYPLYTYAQDMSPGQVLGNGVGGVWHVITGSVLSASPASAAAASLADTSSTSGSSGSSGSSATSGATSAPSATSNGYGGGY
jgi:predicted lipoprotein with Yx(FWY)xxD motif